MKRYTFRLATVLRLRRAEEEQARERLGAANANLRRLLLVQESEGARYRELAASHDATTLDGLLAEQQGATLAAASMAAARQAATRAATEAALAQVAWTGASRRLKVLERLDERRRAEHAEQVQRSEVATIDDMVTARYVRDHRSIAASGASPREDRLDRARDQASARVGAGQ